MDGLDHCGPTAFVVDEVSLSGREHSGDEHTHGPTRRIVTVVIPKTGRDAVDINGQSLPPLFTPFTPSPEPQKARFDAPKVVGAQERFDGRRRRGYTRVRLA